MKKLYQTSWHGIPFNSFAKPSATDLPEASFYDSFYEIFHKKYKNIDDLDPSWVSLKRQAADFIIHNPNIKKSDRILSIGCGLGLMEMMLLKEGFSNLEVTEVSEAPLRWIRSLIPPENVHVGFFPDCVPSEKRYDFILLAGVEYFLDEAQFLSLLRSVHESLLPGGVCMILSWSSDILNPVQRLFTGTKELIQNIMQRCGIRQRGQFWGYLRRPDEFRRALEAAGFRDLRDGTLDTKTMWNTYWIEAVKKG
jgi:SAM-dependent methyltransferase